MTTKPTNIDGREVLWHGVVPEKTPYGDDPDEVAVVESVRKIDHEMLIAERRALFSRDNVLWAGENEVRTIYPPIQCLSPHDAEVMFLRHARSMGIE